MEQISDLERSIRQFESQHPQFDIKHRVAHAIQRTLGLNKHPRLPGYVTLSLGDVVRRDVAVYDKVSLDTISLITSGKASPAYWGHPLVQEAILRLVKPFEMLVHHYNRGTAMLLQKRYDAALRDFEYCVQLIRKLELTPESIKFLPEDARHDLEYHLSIVFNNYGYTLMQLRRFREAIPILQKSLEFDPKAIYANNNLGDSFKALGLTFQARIHYASELVINPTHPTARQNLH